MRNTSFMVTFDVSTEILGTNFNLRCTACPRHDEAPAVLWLEDIAPVQGVMEGNLLPPPFWETIETQLRNGGPARDAFEAAMSSASIPFLAEAAE
jgi:hypothetical protein